MFAHNDYQEITFVDGTGNSVTLLPELKVTADLASGHIPLKYLPNHYQCYETNYDDAAVVTASDVDAILLWSNV